MLGENVRIVVCHLNNLLKFPCIINLNERFNFNFFGAPLPAIPESPWFKTLEKTLSNDALPILSIQIIKFKENFIVFFILFMPPVTRTG